MARVKPTPGTYMYHVHGVSCFKSFSLGSWVSSSLKTCEHINFQFYCMRVIGFKDLWYVTQFVHFKVTHSLESVCFKKCIY